MTIYEKINQILAPFPFVMIEQKDGKIYHLKDHWTYLIPQRQAKRVLIGTGRIGPGDFIYITHPFHCYKRTKF